MTKEELLKPRYKVIADYPCAILEVGQIINTYESAMAYVTESEKACLKDYPHLFRLLQWWEDRKPEEMPEYVKCITTPDQMIMPGEVFKVIWNSNGGGKAADNGPWIFPYTNCFEPSTSEEYINQK